MIEIIDKYCCLSCNRCGREIVNQRYRDNKDTSSEKWLCKACYDKDYRDMPDSHKNIQKALTKSRLGSLDPNSPKAKGDKFEEVTCLWRKVKNLNLENDNFRSKIDHSEDSELGIIQTKGSLLQIRGNRIYWHFKTIVEHRKNFHYLIAYCTDESMKNIERIYIFPYNEVLSRKDIYVQKNRIGWYEKYRVDEKTRTYVNDIFRHIV